MLHPEQVTAVIEREGDGNIGLCPELDIASQGDSIEEALGLFFEAASPVETLCDLHRGMYLTHLDVAVQ